MVVAYSRPSVDFFANCYKELHKAYETGGAWETVLFRAVHPEIERWLRSYWKYRWNRISFVTVEDVIQEGFISIVRYMKKYRYICSVCGNESRLRIEHDQHCEQEHGVELEPRTTLSVYLSLNAMGRMRNVMRDLMVEKKGLDRTLNEASLYDWGVSLAPVRRALREIFGARVIPNVLVDRTNQPYRDFLSKQRLGKFLDRLQSEPVQKVKVYMETILKGGTEADACRRMVNLGMVPNTESARGSINYYKRTRKFQQYREDLEG